MNSVHVIGLGITDDAVRDQLEAIASAGGTVARYATTQAELRAALRDVFEREIR